MRSIVLTSLSKFTNEVRPAVIAAVIFSKKICRMDLQFSMEGGKLGLSHVHLTKSLGKKIAVDIPEGRASFLGFQNYDKILF